MKISAWAQNASAAGRDAVIRSQSARWMQPCRFFFETWIAPPFMLRRRWAIEAERLTGVELRGISSHACEVGLDNCPNPKLLSQTSNGAGGRFARPKSHAETF
jgi:hypothetical protein